MKKTLLIPAIIIAALLFSVLMANKANTDYERTLANEARFEDYRENMEKYVDFSVFGQNIDHLWADSTVWVIVGNGHPDEMYHEYQPDNRLTVRENIQRALYESRSSYNEYIQIVLREDVFAYFY